MLGSMNYGHVDPASIPSALVGSAAGLEMTVRLGQSLELTNALWDLVPVVISAGEEHDRSSPDDVADASPSGRRLDSDARSRVRDAACRWEETVFSSFDPGKVDPGPVASWTEAQLMADPFGAVATMIDLPSVAGQLMPALADAGLASADEVLYFSAYVQAKARSQRTPLLLRALFVTAVSTVEPLVTRMVHLLLHHTEPQTYAALTDPELDKKTRELCAGPPAKWRKVLERRFGIASITSAVDWDRLDLLWQDRNAMAHRGAVVDARHNSSTGTAIGTILDPSPDEVKSAIDDIGAARYGIVTAVWDHLAPGMGARLAAEIWVSLWESLRAGRWRQAEGLGRIQETFADGPEMVANAKVNRWLARDQGLGTEAIREEVQAWEIADLPPEYLMARHLLLRQDDRGLRLLRKLVADGSVTRVDLDAWPLLDRLSSRGLLGEFDR
jgi:hypothetical protein